jgi:hypothetical protein
MFFIISFILELIYELTGTDVKVPMITDESVIKASSVRT